MLSFETVTTVRTENTVLYHGDCLEIMPQLPESSVDLALIDPPFGLTRNQWDTVIPLPPLWENLERVCKQNAAILFFSQMPFAAELVMSNKKMFRYEWIWQKSNKTGFLNAKKMPLKEHENILVFYRHLPKYNPQMEKGKRHLRQTRTKSVNYGQYHNTEPEYSNEYYHGDILSFPCVFHTSEKQVHPTQKPVPLLEYLIKTYSNPGEIVLDCCMGSGSTGVAAVDTGRRFIGIEQDSGYFQTAAERIQEAVSVDWAVSGRVDVSDW